MDFGIISWRAEQMNIIFDVMIAISVQALEIFFSYLLDLLPEK